MLYGSIALNISLRRRKSSNVEKPNFYVFNMPTVCLMNKLLCMIYIFLIYIVDEAVHVYYSTTNHRIKK